MADKADIIVICGPTATGKTALSVALAKLLDGEVVSADSMQIYKGLRVGTAQATPEEMKGVPHHLVGFLPPEERFSVADYVRHAGECIAQITARGRVPIVAGGKEKKERVMSDKERKIVSYHEVGHAMVTALQKNTEPVQKITIVPRTMGALGYTLQTPEEEKYLQTKDELLAKITTYMAGRAAEVLVFQSATSGAANDIEQATAIARAMVTQYGMSDKFGMMCLATVENQYLDNRAGLICGEDTAAQIDKEVLAIINHAYDEAIRLLTENREVLDHIAEYLYEHETITGKEFMKIFRELKGIPEPEDEAEKKTFFEQAEEARQELEEGKTAAESQNMDDVLLRNTQDHEEQ